MDRNLANGDQPRMSRTYKATGINLKAMPMGESDRLLTVLTQEYGLVQAIAPGSRKYKSSLGGRSGLFVVNRLELVQGRSLDKIIQAETIQSYPGLSQSLGTLMAGQYLAELALFQALSHQSQSELFSLLTEHLWRLEQVSLFQPNSNSQGLTRLTLTRLCHAVFHLLALAGVAPQVHCCTITQQGLLPLTDRPSWWVGFSTTSGGIVAMTVNPLPDLTTRLTAVQLALLQELTQPNLQWLDVGDNVPQSSMVMAASIKDWLVIEQVLRHYAQYHFERPIRSADLMDSYLASVLSLV